MHGFLMIPTALIPQWTKDNVPNYSLGLFSNDNSMMMIDDAHPVSTYQKWLGPNFHMYDQFRAMCQVVTAEEFKAMRADPLSVWYAPPEVD